nr:MAG TPA: hypothetical protein [Caudoviricetes sp.]
MSSQARWRKFVSKINTVRHSMESCVILVRYLLNSL